MPIPANAHPGDRAVYAALCRAVGRDFADEKPSGMEKQPMRVRWNNAGHIVFLNLEQMALTALPPEVAQLTALYWLDVSHNQLTALPPEVAQLTLLEYLYLYDNQLTALPSELGRLNALELLDVANNQLTTLPPELGELTALQTLDVSENPLHTPPPEICEQGRDAILQFLRDMVDENGIPRHEGKLLLLGAGGVGKTQFLKHLRRNCDGKAQASEKTARTYGVDVERVERSHPDKPGVRMGLSVWDFEGQVISHTTHQFFLTERSLYLLLWNARRGWQQCDIPRWLNTITARAPDARILLVATYADPINRPDDEATPVIPFADFQAAYPHIIGQASVSNESGMGIAELCDMVGREAAALPLMGQIWPRTWLLAEQTLAQMGADGRYDITLAEYRKICQECGMDSQTAWDALGRYLHDLGRIVHFADDPDPALCDMVVLQPEWLTKAISHVLNDKEIGARKGVLDHATDLPRLWAAEYDKTLWPKFLRLMDRFDLLYFMDESESKNKNKRILLPLLLPDDIPDDLPEPIPGVPCVTLIYTIPALPEGILPRFIARTHRHGDASHWRNGVLLRKDGQTARVELNQTTEPKEIRLQVWGSQPEGFAYFLKGVLEDILGDFPGVWDKLTRRIPCVCSTCKESPKPFLFNYQTVTNRREKNKEDIDCGIGDLEAVPIATLLFGLHPSTEREVWAQILANQAQQLEETRQLRELTVRQFLREWRERQQAQSRECPSLFELFTDDGATLDPRWMAGRPLRLHLVCQNPARPHVTKTYYPIVDARTWVETMRPWLSCLHERFLPYVPIAGAAATVGGIPGAGLLKEIAARLGKPPKSPVSAGERGVVREAEGESLAKLYEFLRDQKAMQGSHRIGDLTRTPIEDGSFLWLCDECRSLPLYRDESPQI